MCINFNNICVDALEFYLNKRNKLIHDVNEFDILFVSYGILSYVYLVNWTV